MNKNDLKRTKGDIIHSLSKAGLSGIPCVGGTISELFSLIISSPISKRRDNLIIEIIVSLQDIEKKVENFKVEKLTENEHFITTLLNGLQIGIRTHQKEKIEAIKNSILNSSIELSPDDDITHMFLNFIDNFFAGHIKLLYFFHDTKKWINNKKIELESDYYQFSTFFKSIFEDYETKKDYYYQIISELSNNRLLKITISSFNNTDSFKKNNFMGSYTTDFGNRFVKYISSPY